MMRHKSLKSDTYPEGNTVNVAGISVKVSAYYPGRSMIFPAQAGYHHREVMKRDQRSQQRSYEVHRLRTKGPNLN
jgi:hypothetical protein